MKFTTILSLILIKHSDELFLSFEGQSSDPSNSVKGKVPEEQSSVHCVCWGMHRIVNKITSIIPPFVYYTAFKILNIFPFSQVQLKCHVLLWSVSLRHK